MKKFNLSVYFVADPSVCGGWDVVDVIAAAVRGGASMVQYRDKTNAPDIIIHNAFRIKEKLEALFRELSRHIPFLINDHVGIAKDIGADGVHIGQDDMAPEEARALLGPDAIIGLTAFDEAQIGAVNPGIVDYIGTGPFYETQTDKGKPVLGPARFANLVKASPVPVVGIGGITAANAGAVIDAGAHGVAMMRAISEAEDPETAAQDILNVVMGQHLEVLL